MCSSLKFSSNPNPSCSGISSSSLSVTFCQDEVQSGHDIMVLSLLKATIEIMVSEDHSLTQADADYLSVFVAEGDARLVEGFKASQGNREVFLSTAVAPILQTKAQTGLANNKYARYKNVSLQVHQDSTSFEKRLNRLAKKMSVGFP